MLTATVEPEDHKRQLKQVASGEIGKEGPKDWKYPCLEKNQCAYCKEEGYCSRKCPKKKKPFQTMVLEDVTRDTEYGGQGLDPIPEFWVTL